MPNRLVPALSRTFDPESAAQALENLLESEALRDSDLAEFPETFLASLAEVLLISPPMLDSLRRHPEWIGLLRGRIQIAETGTVEVDAAWSEWEREQAGREGWLDALRAFKRFQYLAIVYRDISGTAVFEETVSALSRLADVLIGGALRYCWNSLASERPERFALSDNVEGFSIFALGKHGGHELNYSSDVDLLFFRRPSEDPQELRFFTRLGERLIQCLSQAGPDGFLYRVDMRLRPYGESGPLVPTFDSLVNYYESWAEAWERQALIKARFIAGSVPLARRFLEFLDRYTFARQMEDSSLEEIKRVKHRAEREYAPSSGRVNVKQGPGGIRDIEFYVQFLQLVGGKKHPQVRSGSTLEAIGRLAEARLLLEGEESSLSLAYQFLRIVEHRLQLRSLTPSAILPEDANELESLARGLGWTAAGFWAVEKFQKVLGYYRASVRTILERIYLTPGYLHLREKEEELARLLSERAPRERIRQLLSHYGFQDVDKAWQNIRLMALGPAGRMLPPSERRAFFEFALPMLEVLRDSIDPDLGLHHLESLSAATGNRISFLRALCSRRAHLSRVSNLLALGNLTQRILTRHPEFFDTLASGIHLERGREADEMLQELHDRTGQSPRGEVKEDLLRRFRQRELIRIAYRDLANLASAVEISRELSCLAEACVAAAVDIASPGSFDQDEPEFPDLGAIALGKLGSRQMHYASDLDLIFAYPSPEKASPKRRASIQRKLDGQVERILQLLAGVTSEGVAYRVDLRLRPEGASGLLARSWKSFEEYTEQYMEPWERMALVRSRPLRSSAANAQNWQRLVQHVVYEYPWDDPSLEAIRHLKRRIEKEKSRESRAHLDFKYGPGGVADLEFLVQFLQILYGAKDSSVRAVSALDAIPALQASGALKRFEASVLLDACRFQRSVENHYQLMEEWALRETSRESPQVLRLARSLGFSTGSAMEDRRRFLSAWDDHARAVRGLVEKYFFAG